MYEPTFDNSAIYLSTDEIIDGITGRKHSNLCHLHNLSILDNHSVHTTMNGDTKNIWSQNIDQLCGPNKYTTIHRIYNMV